MYATLPWGSRDNSRTTDTTATTMTDSVVSDVYSYMMSPPVSVPESSKYNNIHSNFKLSIKDSKLPTETVAEYEASKECCRYNENKYKFNYDLVFFEKALQMLNTDRFNNQKSYLIDVSPLLPSIQTENIEPVDIDTIGEQIEICRVSLKNLDKLQLILVGSNIKGIPIYTKEKNGNRIKVATIDRSNITHIHLSILSIYNGEGVELLMKILNRALKIISNSREKNFSLIFEKAIDHNISKNKVKIHDIMKQISDSQKQLEQAKRSYKLLSKLYQNNDTKKDSIRNFEVMKKDKRIKDIKVRNNLIYVFTNNIKIDIKDIDVFDIGRYEIVYNLLDGDVKIFNQKKLESYQHPHISSEGYPCWGNISTSIPKLLAKLDLVGLTNLILKFLSSYRDEDAYTNIYNFIGKSAPSQEANSVITTGSISAGNM